MKKLIFILFISSFLCKCSFKQNSNDVNITYISKSSIYNTDRKSSITKVIQVKNDTIFKTSSNRIGGNSYHYYSLINQQNKDTLLELLSKIKTKKVDTIYESSSYIGNAYFISSNSFDVEIYSRNFPLEIKKLILFLDKLYEDINFIPKNIPECLRNVFFNYERNNGETIYLSMIDSYNIWREILKKECKSDLDFAGEGKYYEALYPPDYNGRKIKKVFKIDGRLYLEVTGDNDTD